MKHGLVQLPRPMLVGIAQRRACGRFRQAQVLQLPLAGLQSFGDLAQRLGLRQLAEQHGNQLPPTGEATRMPLCLVLAHCGFEAIARDQLENLAENATYSFQGEVSSVEWFVLAGTETTLPEASPSPS